MRRNEIDVTVAVVRERERESKRIEKTCSICDAQIRAKNIDGRMDCRKKLDESVNFQKKINRAFPKDGLSFLCTSSNEMDSEKLKKVECEQKYKLKIREYKELNNRKLEAMIAGSKEKLVTERGITLLALIITVVIMIILAAVTINVTLGDGGLVQQARLAAERTQSAAEKEQAEIDSLQQELANILAEDGEITPPELDENNETGGDIVKPEEPSVSETETQVANYADVDGNGTVDGIIYADLAIGGSETEWGNSNGTYIIPKGNNFKKYKVIQESYSGDFGSGKVIAPIDRDSGNERFYVMALKDVDSNYHTWYEAAAGQMSDYATYTSTAFGAGEQNTSKMITKWNNSEYGPQNYHGTYTDIWGLSAVQSGTWNSSNGWYIPSRGEWSAFVNQLEITTSNYSSKALSDSYWSSSQTNANFAWSAGFTTGCMNYVHVGVNYYVRLGTTF